MTRHRAEKLLAKNSRKKANIKTRKKAEAEAALKDEEQFNLDIAEHNEKVSAASAKQAKQRKREGPFFECGSAMASHTLNSSLEVC